VRGLIGETWRLLRSHGRRLLVVALVFLVPANLAVAYAREDSETLGLTADLVFALVGYAWIYGALVATIARPSRSAVEPYGRTVDRLPALVIANFVALLAILVGLLLLIVPGLLISARWIAANPLIVIDRRGPFAALEGSNRLIRGRTWTVVGAFVIVALTAAALALPGWIIGWIADPAWAVGLAIALGDVVFTLPVIALMFAAYRQAQAL
jgi:hypothetical protein